MLHFKNQFCANNAKGFLFKFCDGISRKLFLVLKILTIPLLILTDIHSTHCIAAHIKYWNKICLEKNIDSYIIIFDKKPKKIPNLEPSQNFEKKTFSWTDSSSRGIQFLQSRSLTFQYICKRWVTCGSYWIPYREKIRVSTVEIFQCHISFHQYFFCSDTPTDTL